MADAMLAQGDTAAARSTYQRALSLDPYFASAYFFAGTALTVRELDPPASLAARRVRLEASLQALAEALATTFEE